MPTVPSAGVSSVRRSGARGFAVAAALGLLGAACADDRVQVAFRPPAGSAQAYEVRVEAESRSEIEGRAPERTREEARLRTAHAVLPSGGGPGTRVRVELRGAGDPAPATFVVVLDGAARLVRVEAADGGPADLLGVFGLAEIFPAAAGGPPGRLAPGEAWTIDEPVELPGAAPARLRGRGRLVELGVVDGRDVAVVETFTELSVRRAARDTPTGPLELRGVQTTRSRTSHAVGDGAVERAESVTRGEFEVDLLPPGGDPALAVHGRISVTVHSTTRRVG